jgi:hypothetical protein
LGEKKLHKRNKLFLHKIYIKIPGVVWEKIINIGSIGLIRLENEIMIYSENIILTPGGRARLTSRSAIGTPRVKRIKMHCVELF